MPNPNLPISLNTNTYIGARYVPVFADPIEWSENTKYEPLTIVTYNGNSYTSRTFPPVGTVPTNETYWAMTGNYNAQIEQYKQETQEVKEELDNIQIQVNTNSKNIQINSQNISLLTKKSIIVIGDSYTTQYVKDNTTVIPWVVQIKQYLPNYNFFVSAEDGAGFGVNISSQDPIRHNFYQLFQNLLNTLSSDQKMNITDVIIFGGANDIKYTTSDITTGMNNFKTLMNNVPNAKCNIFLAGLYLTNNTNAETLIGTIYPHYLFASGRHGWGCFDVWKQLHASFYMSSDMTHPNNVGQNILASSMVGYFIGGYPTFIRYLQRNHITGDITGETFLANDGIQFTISNHTLNFDTPITLTSSLVQIGTFSSYVIFNRTDNNYMALPVLIRTTEGNYNRYNMQFALRNVINSDGTTTGTIFGRLYDYVDSTGNALSISVNRIVFIKYFGVLSYMYN